MDDAAFALPADDARHAGVAAGVEEPASAYTLERASRPQVTGEVTRGAARLLVGLGYAPLLEVPLPNGRRADLLAVDAKGCFAIVEVKSSVEDLRADGKWPQYAPWCDRFFFAVSPEFPVELLPAGCGVIVADAFGGMVRTDAPEAALAPARRKSLTLQFARLAAWRATGAY